ncbi:hypothetical protein [Pseudomonas ogarae]|uniref:hypothetical protein n=2 Tax=Pseudomonas TaxID=286 RepID=UPI001C47EE83|nr:hypothetical protein [Pseudomonas ogarae]
MDNAAKSFRSNVGPASWMKARMCLWTCYLLLFIATSIPFMSFFDIRPTFENPVFWFQRTGCITTVFSLVCIALADTAVRLIPKPSEDFRTHTQEAVDAYLKKIYQARASAMVVALMGALVWGYGDTFIRYMGSA